MVLQEYLDKLSVASQLPLVIFNMGGHHQVVTLVIGSAIGGPKESYFNEEISDFFCSRRLALTAGVEPTLGWRSGFYLILMGRAPDHAESRLGAENQVRSTGRLSALGALDARNNIPQLMYIGVLNRREASWKGCLSLLCFQLRFARSRTSRLAALLDRRHWC